MTSTDPAASGAWILTGGGWAAPGGSETLVAQIDLAVATAHQPVLPREGWLVLFVGPVGAGADSEPRPAHGVVLDFPTATGPALEPMALNAELVIPRLWHEAVQALGFDEVEAEAYARVRARLRELQGVEDDDNGGLAIAYHRLFGYPNETTGSMPSDCARAAGEDSPHPEHWRLLSQNSLDSQRRLYIWIRDSDLRLGRFERLCAFVRR